MSPWINAGSGSALKPLSSQGGISSNFARVRLPLAQALYQSSIAARFPQTKPSSSDVDASRFAPCTPSATDLANCIQVANRRTRPLIHQHAAAEIVCSRHDRHWLARNVQTHFQALVIDERKPFANRFRRHVRGDVEQDVRVRRSLPSRDESRAPRCRAAQGLSTRANNRSMNGRRSGVNNTPPSPRTASLISKPSAPGAASAVG